MLNAFLEPSAPGYKKKGAPEVAEQRRLRPEFTMLGDHDYFGQEQVLGQTLPDLPPSPPGAALLMKATYVQSIDPRRVQRFASI